MATLSLLRCEIHISGIWHFHFPSFASNHIVFFLSGQQLLGNIISVSNPMRKHNNLLIALFHFQTLLHFVFLESFIILNFEFLKTKLDRKRKWNHIKRRTNKSPSVLKAAGKMFPKLSFPISCAMCAWRRGHTSWSADFSSCFNCISNLFNCIFSNTVFETKCIFYVHCEENTKSWSADFYFCFNCISNVGQNVFCSCGRIHLFHIRKWEYIGEYISQYIST